MRYLYRGVSEQLYRKLSGKLTPKLCNALLANFAACGDPHSICGSGMECGESDLNTVILHQGEQAGIPTSGISTSPYLPRAKYYALTAGKTNIGYVFQLSVKKPLNIDVTIYRVNDLIPHPAAHEDDDHILVANDCGRIPEIAIESISLVTNNT